MQNAECTMRNAECTDATPRMTKKEAIVAIQIAVRCIAKRFFDRERSFKRRHMAEDARDEGRTTKDEGETAAPQDIPPKAVPENQEGDAE